VVAGEEPWRSNDVLRAVALSDSFDAMEIHGLGQARLDDLALVGHRLKPWPDAVQALEELRESFTVAALSNADLAQLVDMFGEGRLAWHGVLSAELVKTYQPDPAVSRLAWPRGPTDVDGRHTPGICGPRPATVCAPPLSCESERGSPRRTTDSTYTPRASRTCMSN
jgi:hypothetical protein